MLLNFLPCKSVLEYYNIVICTYNVIYNLIIALLRNVSFYLDIEKYMPKKIALVIFDWFWINDKTPEENGIVQANTPTFDQLFSSTFWKLKASGLAVGLPDGQMGNSEVWHTTLWTGRIIKQSLVEISELFDEWKFSELESFKTWIEHVRQNESALHILSLFWPGGVHSLDTHMLNMIKIIPSDIQTYLHLFLDGRDVLPQSAAGFMKDFEKFLKDYPNVKISTVWWRYRWMDRDNNWDRVQKAYDEIVFQQTQTSDTPTEYIEKRYEAEETDEFVAPVSFLNSEPIEDWDSVFFLNFRADRARQMTQALQVSQDEKKIGLCEKWNPIFITKRMPNLYFVAMTKYYKEYDGPTFLEQKNIQNTLSELLSNHDLRQLHLAETEKFAHVTKFFNAEQEIVYDGQKNILVPSHKVATYDLDPEMSAEEILQTLFEETQNFDAFIVNFANWDMVWHTGKMPAVIQAVEKLDNVVARLLERSKNENVDILLTADHGNCEQMWTPEHPMTAHTTNLVPFWYIHKWEVQDNIEKSGWLSDIAPTILKLFWVEIPSEMTGKSLIK